MTTKQEKAEATESLRKFVQEGSTVYTVIRSVSKSGMSRCMDVYAFYQDEKGRIQKQYLTGWCAKLGLGSQSMEQWRKGAGMRVNGCGMDMGFHVADSMSYALFGKSSHATNIRHEWI